ncbi:hypothetical protein DUNSADRAFT_8820 [Dunaliella salina]|uniref:Uncharacterized protein n=1 Tax=Dunaliella salina TaxID=3046 RepID=A0ABQ7GIR0_DUNSA|nr:hypothetical protein DUNSADRAFT_8820 [Dunaliella salina]|eukprot:KAF5834464.1 hypothetical protein DUNSADRAFT_8820 [Dunaliella salina]
MKLSAFVVKQSQRRPYIVSMDVCNTERCAFAAYFSLGRIVTSLCPGDSTALQLWEAEVPLILSQMSATAFFTAMVLNMTSFLFEDSVTKRQLALLSCTIKAAACYSDLLLAMGQLPIVFDAHGSLLIPQRYVQWAVTTPLMVFIISKLVGVLSLACHQSFVPMQMT